MTKRGNKVQTQVHIRRDFSGVHDGYCRCQVCKPPMVGEARLGRSMMIGAILGLLLVLVVAFNG